MKTWKISCLLVLLSALVSGIAQSSIISIDDPVFGPDSITYDTISGFEWLDVTKSLGRSYDDVSSQFGVGGDFEAWTYAGSYQLGQLISHWTGYPSVRINRKSTEPYHEAFNLDGLIDLLGATDSKRDDDFSLTRGITGSSYSSRYVWVGQIFDFPETATDPVLDYYIASHFYTGRASVDPTRGSFLVRYATASVPSPGTALLLVPALGFLRRFHKQS